MDLSSKFWVKYVFPLIPHKYVLLNFIYLFCLSYGNISVIGQLPNLEIFLEVVTALLQCTWYQLEQAALCCFRGISFWN